MKKTIITICLFFCITQIFGAIVLIDDIEPKGGAFNVMLDLKYLGNTTTDVSADADTDHLLDVAFMETAAVSNGDTTHIATCDAIYDFVFGGYNGYSFKTITGITNDVVADSNADTLTLASANARLTIVGTTATDTITFAADTDLHNYSWTNVVAADYKTGSVTQAYNANLTGINQGLSTTGTPTFSTVAATTFTGALSGNATTSSSTSGNAGSATYASATTITDDTSTAATMYPLWVTANTGNLATKVSSTKLSFVPSTGILTATGFSGPLTGNVTGNASGSSGSCTGNAATVTTNANLTGPITSVGNATSIASQTGTGTKFVVDTSPTLVTPVLGVAAGTSLTLNSAATGSTLNVKGTASVAVVGAVNKLTADGGFDANTGWTYTGWTIASSKARHDSGNVTALEGTTTVESGKTYQINYTLADTLLGITVWLGTNSSYKLSTANGSITVYAVASGNNVNVKFVPSSTSCRKSVDSVTIYEVTASTADVKIESSDGSANPLTIRAGGDSLGSFFLGSGGGTLSLGAYNTGLGTNCLAANTSGAYNVAIGGNALKSNIYGSYNTAIGPYSLYSYLYGDNAVAVGPYALYSLPNSTSNGSVAIGSYALYSYTYPSIANTAIGAYALQDTTTGIGLTAIGENAFKDNVSGGYDVVIGTDAAPVTLIENYSTIIGYQAFYFHKIGLSNIVIGYKAGYDDISGELNTLIGTFAGENLAQPVKTITAITNNGSGKCRYASVAHGFTTADFIYVYACDVAAYNTTPGTSLGISATTADTFDSTDTYTSDATTGSAVKYGLGRKNTMLGCYAGDLATTLSNSVFLGAYAGCRQTTTNNLLVIDNQDRGSAAAEATNALIYGTFAAAPANQILTINAKIATPVTITAVGTTGAQTINKPCGRVNIAAAGTSVVVTNSLVTANSIVMAVAATNDATARVTSVVPAAGSFTIYTVATTAETAFNFFVLN